MAKQLYLIIKLLTSKWRKSENSGMKNLKKSKFGQNEEREMKIEEDYERLRTMNFKRESTRSLSNKWTKTLYRHYLHCVAKCCATVLKTNHF